MKVIKQTDILEMLPFKKTKTYYMLRNGILPVVKVGKDYITTEKKMEDWISANIGKDVY